MPVGATQAHSIVPLTGPCRGSTSPPSFPSLPPSHASTFCHPPKLPPSGSCHCWLAEFILTHSIPTLKGLVRGGAKALPPLCTRNAPCLPQIFPSGSFHCRLSQLVGWCNGDTPSNAPFGVNPHFLSTSSLYDPTLLSNKTQLDDSSFGFKLVYNPQGLPYGFIYPQVRIVLANTRLIQHATSYEAD